ncbi:MAG: hypothetical protein HY070_05825 [Chloroflexi bacterium]|nr:hypothetical protein [Chloroflexota bacterium]
MSQGQGQGGGSIIAQLIGLLLNLLKSFQSAPAQPSEPSTPGEPSQPATPETPVDLGKLESLSPRVLLIVYNPVVDSASGKKLLSAVSWFNNPDELIAGYVQDLAAVSNGLVNYKIVETVEDTTFAAKDNGYVFQGSDFVSAYTTRQPLDGNMVDYGAILAKYNIVQRVANNELDEVWLMGYPNAGFYESTMGGRGAFWCNGPVLPNTEKCPRRFVVMGFNFERGIGEMEEAFGHRTESIMEQVYHGKTESANLWHRFIQYEQKNSGEANDGWMHYAPNSVQDYDWGNLTPVQSCADDWYQFPNLPNPPIYRTMTANDWGNGDIRKHHTWWFKHLPKVEGVTDSVANNWWKYAVDPNNVSVGRRTGMIADPEPKLYLHPWGSMPHHQ